MKKKTFFWTFSLFFIFFFQSFKFHRVLKNWPTIPVKKKKSQLGGNSKLIYFFFLQSDFFEHSTPTHKKKQLGFLFFCLFSIHSTSPSGEKRPTQSGLVFFFSSPKSEENMRSFVSAQLRCKLPRQDVPTFSFDHVKWEENKVVIYELFVCVWGGGCCATPNIYKNCYSRENFVMCRDCFWKQKKKRIDRTRKKSPIKKKKKLSIKSLTFLFTIIDFHRNAEKYAYFYWKLKKNRAHFYHCFVLIFKVCWMFVRTFFVVYDLTCHFELRKELEFVILSQYGGFADVCSSVLVFFFVLMWSFWTSETRKKRRLTLSLSLSLSPSGMILFFFFEFFFSECVVHFWMKSLKPKRQLKINQTHMASCPQASHAQHTQLIRDHSQIP